MKCIIKASVVISLEIEVCLAGKPKLMYSFFLSFY